MESKEQTKSQILSYAAVFASASRMFQGNEEGGLPAKGSFPSWLDDFEKFDGGIRSRVGGNEPVAGYVIEDSLGWFVGESIVSLTELLKDFHQDAAQTVGINYLTLRELYDQIHPVAQSCTLQLCSAHIDLLKTRANHQSGPEPYGCAEVEDLHKRLPPALEHLEEGARGVRRIEGELPSGAQAGKDYVENLERAKLLRLWELLEIAIPRMKENDKGPLLEVMKQLIKPGPDGAKQTPEQMLGEETEQGFVFRVRHLVGNRLSNSDRALLSDARAALMQSRREFLTIKALVSAYHQMLVAPRALEDTNAAVQYALLSKQRRFASRACRDLEDSSPKDNSQLNQAGAAANEMEAKLDPDAILAGLLKPVETQESDVSTADKPAKRPKGGMHTRKR